jgi:hypothetical protein
MKKMKLEELIRMFAMEQSGSFAFDALVKYVQLEESSFDEEGRLHQIACDSIWLFSDDRDEDFDSFIPRHCFFKGAEFLVKPLPEEVAGGYLVPGHRFVPFLSHGVAPFEVTLQLPDGSDAAKRVESFPHEMTLRFLLYFGEYGMIDYLISDHESNGPQLQPPFDKPLDVTVFDLRAFYDQCGFKVGDSLVLKVDDSRKGVLSVRHLPSKGKTVDFVGTRVWADAMRAGFEEMQSIEDPSFDCKEQIAWMYCFAEQDEDSPAVLNDPPLSLPDFFRKQTDLTIKTLGQVCFLWPVDIPVEERMMAFMDDKPEPETELDAFFQMFNLSLDTDDAEAYMRDAIASGENDPAQVLERVLDGRDLMFPNQIVLEEFVDLWEELWREVQERYNPEKDDFRESRSVFLGFNDQCLKILRAMDQAGVDPVEIMGNQDYMKLGEISGMIHSVLVMSNQIEGEVDTPVLPLNEIKGSLGAVLDDLSQRLLQDQADKEQEISDRPIYQLKITLKGSKPPIWRRVLISSGMPLEKLHDIIQLTFGWYNCHLHQFVVGRTYYQPGGPDEDGFGMMDVEDSNGLRVCELLRSEKDKISYEYDFGDGWDHQILLEKVLPPKPEKALPVCVKGLRACPPEDCGGIYGYYHLLETINGPDCAEKEELLEWTCGPIDPDAFDLVGINARLKERF